MLFRHPDYYIAIVEEKSLSAAAERLFVSQPSLSQYLKKLEEELGADLFDHACSPLKPTYAGERYYHYAREAVRLEMTVRREIHDIQSQEIGVLKLGVALWRGAVILPDIFPDFHRLYPGIQIELHEGNSEKMADDLIKDRTQLAVMNLPKTLDYGKLTAEILFQERILLALPSSHPAVIALLSTAKKDFRNYPIAPLSILHQVPLIATKPGMNLTLEVRHILEKNHIEPEIVLETNNTTTAINLVSAGVGGAFVPEEGSRICTHPGKVTYFSLDTPDAVWPLAAVQKKGAYVSHIARLFMDYIKEAFHLSSGQIQQ